MVNTWHHARGGDTTYTRGLTRLLEADGHRVVPLAMRHPDNDPSLWEQRFVSLVEPRAARSRSQRLRLAARLFWSREAEAAAAALVRETRPDVAHLQHVHRHITPSVLRPLRDAGVPVVWTLHDYELVCPAGTLFTEGRVCERCLHGGYVEAVRHRCKWGELEPSLAAAAEKLLHRLAGVWEMVDRFLCPSRFLADVLVRAGVDARRVTHLPNFLDAREIEPGQGPGNGWLYAGRLAPEKGVQVAIEAARRLGGPPLHIYGSGPQEAELRARAGPWVRFEGAVPRARLLEALRRVRVVVVPSLWPENFPYAVLEAQAAGRAVLASAVGGIPEQIDDGLDGRLVAAGDVDALASAAGALLARPDDAARLGMNGRSRVLSRLNPDRHLHDLLGIYESICAG